MKSHYPMPPHFSADETGREIPSPFPDALPNPREYLHALKCAGYEIFKMPPQCEYHEVVNAFADDLHEHAIVFAPAERTALYTEAEGTAAITCLRWFPPTGDEGDALGGTLFAQMFFFGIPKLGAVAAPLMMMNKGESLGILEIASTFNGAFVSKYSSEELNDILHQAAHSTLFLPLALLSSGVATVETYTPPPKLNRKLIKHGRTPHVDHKIVHVRPSARRDASEPSGEHPGRRLHWRRGHIRRCASGILAVVRPHLVGTRELGEVLHDAYDCRNMLQLIGGKVSIH